MMIDGKNITRAYFIGIGGIGMSALAQLMKDAGCAVSGSDREESPVTVMLRDKGIEVHFIQDGKGVPLNADVAVYSEAVWEDNPERMRAKELGIREMSYFEVLGEVSKEKTTIAVSGTNGKTTTTGMLAKILADAGAHPTAVVGSIVKDFHSNYLAGSSDLFVVEACEYKRDFLTLSPTILVVTNIEWDHTDYYKDLADVQSAFRELMEKIPASGVIVTDTKNPSIAELLTGLSARIIDYGTETKFILRLPGEFNQMNAAAAAAAARTALPSITEDSIATSLSHFHGTWRRFEYKGKTRGGADVYDDYAHHPTAVQKTLVELRKKTKSLPAGRQGKLIVAFHPHLYSRTRDLFEDFKNAFSGADQVYIAPIYAAREVDERGVSSSLLAEAVTEQGTPAEAKTFEEIEKLLSNAQEGDVVATMGAGDIYKVSNALVA